MTTKHQWFSLVRRSLVALAALAAASGVLVAREGTAFAQRFAEKGTLAITGENLFMFGTERVGNNVGGVDGSTTSNRFGFLYSQCGPTPRCPMVGGHYFIIPSLSLGASLGYESRGSSTTGIRQGVPLTTTNPDFSSFVFIPKVGYSMMFSQVVGFWVRGGPGYFHTGSNQANFTEHTDSYWFIQGDADLVVSPFMHFAFYVGPQFDLSFSGTRTIYTPQGSQAWDASYRDFALGVGLIGYVGL